MTQLKTEVTTVYHVWMDGLGNLVAQTIGGPKSLTVDELNLDPDRYLWVQIPRLERSAIYFAKYGKNRIVAKETRIKELKEINFEQLLRVADELAIDTTEMKSPARIRSAILRREGF